MRDAGEGGEHYEGCGCECAEGVGAVWFRDFRSGASNSILGSGSIVANARLGLLGRCALSRLIEADKSEWKDSHQ